MRRSTLRPWTARTLALLIVVSSWRVASAYQPADDNPQQFQDVACYKDDKKFWKGQESVVNVNVALSGSALGNGTGWIVKGKDPNKVLLMTASHNFTDAQAAKAGITVKLQRPDCGGFKKEMLWFASIDEVLERNTKLDFQIDSLKPPPQGKTYPPPLQPLYKEIKPDLIVSLPQHPAEETLFKQGGYYADIENKKRCFVVPSPAINAIRGEVDARCGGVPGTSGSPLLDASDAMDDTPYPIALIVGCRLKAPKECKPLSVVGFKMSDICDFDASNDGKKLLDCKRPQ